MAALIYALRCQQSDLVQEAVWAARQAYDAADFYVLSRHELDVNTEAGRQRLRNDPVVQAELQRQEVDLQVLERNESRGAKVKHLREAAEAYPVFNFEGVE
jgi:alkylation response protein AidB-like acyl-CoA dehydrogenase